MSACGCFWLVDGCMDVSQIGDRHSQKVGEGAGGNANANKNFIRNDKPSN